MAAQINPEGISLTGALATALHKAGGLDDELGRRLYEELSETPPEGGGSRPAESAMVLTDSAEWLCHHGDAAISEEVIDVVRRVSLFMDNAGDSDSGSKVLENLFNWCNRVLGPRHAKALLVARELGDRANDDTDWDTAQRWYQSMIDDAYLDDTSAQDSIQMTLISHALRELTALALRRREYEVALAYAERDLDLIQRSRAASPRDLALRWGNLADVAEQAGRTEEANEFRRIQRNSLEQN